MKKLLLLFVLSLSLATTAQSQLTEGIIISKQTMTSNNEEMQAQFAMMGDMTTTTYFKDDMSRSEVSSPMTGDIVTITNTSSKEMLMLMDNPMMGKKYMLQKNDVTQEELDKIKMVAGTETKTVLGYACKQYTVTLDQDGVEVYMEMFTTNAIPISSQQSAMFGNKLKGFPLYTITKMDQMGSEMIITTEVTEIKKDAVSDSKFSMTPPEGYEKMDDQ